MLVLSARWSDLLSFYSFVRVNIVLCARAHVQCFRRPFLGQFVVDLFHAAHKRFFPLDQSSLSGWFVFGVITGEVGFIAASYWTRLLLGLSRCVSSVTWKLDQVPAHWSTWLLLLVPGDQLSRESLVSVRNRCSVRGHEDTVTAP